MALVHLSLLLGGIAIGLPIVLHLWLRQRPRQLVFPALRFLQERQRHHQRSLQLRQLLLLLLRCLLLLLLVTALARPAVATVALGDWLLALLAGMLGAVVAAITVAARVYGAGRGWQWGGGITTVVLALLTTALLARAAGAPLPRWSRDREAPVAALLVFDAAPRMDYRAENQSRLEAAREAAEWVLKQLPEGSALAIVDTRPDSPVFTLDRAAAKKAVERLTTSGRTRSLPDTLQASRHWLEQFADRQREVYVFSDLSRGAWPARTAGAAEGTGAGLPEDTRLFVLDVGVEQPKNAWLGDVQLSVQALAPGGELELRTEVSGTGVTGTRTVELLVDRPDPQRPVVRDGVVDWPEEVPRGRQEVELHPTNASAVSFRLAGLPPGITQGRLRLTGADALAIDDERFFSVLVQEATPLLVVVGDGAQAKYLVEAVAPWEERQSGRAAFSCVEIRPPALAEQTLEAFAAVLLLDPPPLAVEDWARLARYVESGGGLGVFLGHNAQPGGSFHDPVALRLLGGTLHRRWRAPTGDVFLAIGSSDHPALREFRELSTTIPWEQFPVYRHWELAPLGEGTRVLARFGNGQPALVEPPGARGRVVVLTTPLSDPLRPRGREAWNELPTGPDAWPFVMLADQLARYLGGSGTVQLNFLTGQTGEWVGRPEQEPEKYLLYLPDGTTQELPVHEGRAAVRSPEQPGQYRLRGYRNGVVLRGFSVNLPLPATDLTRIAEHELDGWCGAGRYQLVRRGADLQRRVGQVRATRGLEFYPALLVALVFVLALEHLLANLFYGLRA
ncbi:MAG: BatA and WFA domain-containing protein [Pirellulales bacterium]